MNNSDSIRERLLARLPNPLDAGSYRAAVAETLQQNQDRIRRERFLVTLFWIFCVISAVAYLWFGVAPAQVPRGPFLACIFFIWGALELTKHHINACRISLLAEIKQLQLQILELQGNRSQASIRE